MRIPSHPPFRPVFLTRLRCTTRTTERMNRTRRLAWMLLTCLFIPGVHLGQLASPWTHGLDIRNIGPSVMSGRVVDVAVVVDTMYVAYATGGLWRSINQGNTFEPLLDEACKLGAVAAHPNGRLVVGSGEANSSRSSYAGTGVWISENHGQTWRHAGLEQARHIGRVAIHPQNPDIIYVAALGELYTPNQGGGVYKSEDGGTTWQRVLNVPGKRSGEVVGAVDLVLDITQPEHILAATWDRTRRAHDFLEGGPGSGIWETLDGGATWSRISSREGFPEGAGTGRIGLALHPNSGTLYAYLDNQDDRPEDERGGDDGSHGDDNPSEPRHGLTRDDFLDMSPQTFQALDDSLLAAFLSEEGFAEADSASSVKARVRAGELKPRALYDYLTDGNAAMFDTHIIGPELYRINLREGNSGTWQRTHEDWLDDVCYTYGYYFGMVAADPSDPNVVYIGGVPLLKSIDGGQTFESIGAPNVHADHHKLWVNPRQPNHLINGNDGGINISWDGGESWTKCNSPAVGQFYAVEVDDATPYRVYGGLQDNGTWVGPSTYTPSAGWQQSGHYPYTSLGGGDGMQIEVDRRTNEVVYTGSQFGWYTRTDQTSGDRHSLRPMHTLGETPLRWNWQTPILLSKHQQDVLYMASNKVHRSLNQGNDWETLSPDLTHGGRAGDVPFGTLTTLAEHPKKFGQLAVGSDDGRVHVTLDGGHVWQELNLPVATSWGKGNERRHMWVSEVMWSHHDQDLLVIALNGYRNDDNSPHVYATTDLGKHWESWGENLPVQPVNALVESADRKGWWFVGHDGGACMTVDGGAHFSSLLLPHVPVHDLVIQERENELIIGTHGRSLYVLDLQPLLDLPGTPEAWASRDLSFTQDVWTVERSEHWGERSWAWGDVREGKAEMWVWSPQEGVATMRVVRSHASFLHDTKTTPQTPSGSNDPATGDGALAVLDRLRNAAPQALDLGPVNLVAGLQKLVVSLADGDDWLEVGTHECILELPGESGTRVAKCTLELVEAER